MNMVYEDLVDDILLVMEENEIGRLKKERLKKKIKKLVKQNRFQFNADSLWIWRLCAARLMRGEFDTWYGYEMRSKWAAAFVQNDWIYPRWDGKNCNMIVLAEQGVGDEILMSSILPEFLKDCPDATIECDIRLMDIFKRSFPEGKFISRWVDDVKRTPQNPNNYKKGEYEAFAPMADLMKYYRKGKTPPGTSYLIPDPERVEKRKEQLAQISDKPKIGISWMGGRSYLEPEKLKKQDGDYIGLQYKNLGTALEPNIVSDPGPEWVHDLKVDHNDFEDVFATVAALDEVNTIQSVIAHVAGSQGKKCNIIKPPPQYATEDNPDNNRLKWYYGIGTSPKIKGDASKWQMPWYKNSTVYANYKILQRQCPHE